MRAGAIVVTSFGAIGAFVACASFSSKADAPQPSDARDGAPPTPSTDAAPTEAAPTGDAAATAVAPLVCGATTCAAGEFCCVTSGDERCTTTCSSGYQFSCFGRANCGGEDICCLVDREATCMPATACTVQTGQIVCESSEECGGGGECEARSCGSRTFNACPSAAPAGCNFL